MVAFSNHDKHGNAPANRPVTAGLHPRVYTVLLCLVVWFTLAVWAFAGGGVTDYLLFVVSGFLFVAVMLPLILSRVGGTQNPQKRRTAEVVDVPFRAWSGQVFDTWAGRLSGGQAAVQVLLPIAAAALGMTIFGITFIIVEHGGA
jgi:hypothetical protein